jgi:succinoglycan biosynthesis transport protein ExoP
MGTIDNTIKINGLQPEGEEEVKSLGESLEELWRIFKRRWQLVVLVVLVVVGFRMFQAYRQTPMYMARGTVLIEHEASNVLIFNNPYRLNSDWRNEYLNTQILILQSRSLARQVVEELMILGKRETGPDGKSNVKDSIISSGSPEEPGGTNNPSLSGAISGFLGGLNISLIENTRLVEVSYISSSPEYSAMAVNTLFENFIRFNLRLKTESTKMASEFLYKQIAELKDSLSKKEKELQEYGKNKELFYLSNKDSTVVEKFGDLNKAFTQAQIHRINMEAVYRELQEKRFEDYPEVRKNTLIQNFKQELSGIEREYKKKSQIYRESYPEMQRLQAQIETLQQRIRQETLDIGKKALKEAEADYQSALKKEQSLSDLLNQQKGEVISTKTDAIYYNSLQIEVTNMRSLLDHLVKKEKESLLTSRLEGLQTSNIKVIDAAEVPLMPIGSGKREIFLMALLIGLMAGAGLAFVLDWLDKTLKTPEEVEKELRLPSLGFIPVLGSENHHMYYPYYQSPEKKKSPKSSVKKIELANFLEPESGIAESYRSVRTSILLSTPEQPPRVITVTSAYPKEGKTATVVNLAVSFSKLGKKVLVVDGDLRKPSIHKVFRAKNTSGVSSFLVGKSQVEDVILKTEVQNLFIIPAGPAPPNPTELLDSRKMSTLLDTLKTNFDFIFIDSPPLIGIVDPVIIGRLCEGSILVVWGGKTHKNRIQKARADLDKYRIRTLGVVLNKVNMKKSVSYGYYSYYSYNYRYKYREESSGKQPDGSGGGSGKRGKSKVPVNEVDSRMFRN